MNNFPGPVRSQRNFKYKNDIYLQYSEQWRRHAREVGCVHTTHLLSGKYTIRKKWQAYTLVNLILKKISEIGATRCQIVRLKCTEIDFGWGSAPDPAGGAYSALPDRQIP